MGRLNRSIIALTIVWLAACCSIQALASTAIFEFSTDEAAPLSFPDNGNKNETHSIVVTRLMNLSAMAQADFVSLLDQLLADGKIESYRAFWIANIVWVEADAQQLEILSGHLDIVSVSEDFAIELIAPVEESASLIASNTAEEGLRIIGATEVWAMGLDGTGALVCNLDTGVNGSHPALVGKYRGNNGGSPDACWFDPYFNTPYPEDDHGHGTHTMGTMVGSHEGDTVGVAPGAQWIAAAVVSRGGGSQRTVSDILAAFQWAADPDGNPSTTEDVPDVVNNSWGIPVGYYPPCDQTFWGAIDNLEAAGVVCLFAAGNEGPSARTMRTPADRITSDVNAFSVGAVYGQRSDLLIADFSSRGPSGCDSLTIKPEVVAPGSSIRSTDRDGGYSFKSGTSMAAPHVSGAVALLRQFNPSATPAEIKRALLLSARDLGQPGEDNDYGWGVIDIHRALYFMPTPERPFPVARGIVSPGDGVILPGEETTIEFRLENLGAAASNLTARMSSTNPAIEILSGDVPVGVFAHAETLSIGPWSVRVAPQANLGDAIELILSLTGLEWNYQMHCVIVVGGEAVAGLASHDNGEVALSISNFGKFGLGPGSVIPMGGVGFRFPSDSPDFLHNGSLLLAIDSLHVSDAAISTEASITDDDFSPVRGGYPRVANPGARAGQDGFARYDDSAAENPLGLEITQNSYCWDGPQASQFVILEFSVRNTTTETISGLYAGIYCDWNTPQSSGDGDIAGYIDTASLGYIAGRLTGVAVGARLLTGPVASYAAIDNNATVSDGFSEAEKFGFITSGFNQTAFDVPGDYSHLMSAGPFIVPPGQSVVVAFSLVGGNNLDELQANSTQSARLYLESSGTSDDPALPNEISIMTNYPNPFNGATRISLSGQANPEEVISIYSIEGRLVREIPMRGSGSVIWDGAGNDGAPVCSGVYFARLRSGQGQGRKMILLK